MSMPNLRKMLLYRSDQFGGNSKG